MADEGDDNYVVSLRGALERAPDPESVFRAAPPLKAMEIDGVVAVPAPSTDAYSPYAEKWKELDKLQNLAKGGGALAWVHWAWGVLLPSIGLFMPHRVPRKDSVMLFAGFAALGTIQLVRVQIAKARFAHWPCPRCGAEWPGTKTEKEPKCAMCGLKLHQLTP